MDQLLEITSVPIKIELQKTPARFEMSTKFVSVKYNRTAGGLEYDTDPIRMKIDNTAWRNSVNLKNCDTFVRDIAAKGRQAGLDAVAQIVKDGNQLALPHRRVTPADISRRNMNRIRETVVDFIPKGGVKISWDGGTVDFKYNRSDIEFDVEPSTLDIRYVPAQLEYFISQYPRVDIKYVGEPFYFPPSSAPGYAEQELDMLI